MVQPQQSPAAISSLAEARQLSDGLIEVMTTLLDVLEDEIALVRAGKLREAMALEARKSELSRCYVGIIGQFQRNQAFFARSTPELLKALHRHHDKFRAMLQVNLTVLATAHAVSEGIIRGVNVEMQKKSKPQTYTAAGQRTTPNLRRATPMSLNRSL